jgi:hypothetical protein
MEEKQHTHLSKFTDFPLYVYIVGLFLLFLGIAAQICVEVNSGLWNDQPKEWKELKLIDPDCGSDDLRKKLGEEVKETFGPKCSKGAEVKQGKFREKAGKGFPSWWGECLLEEKGINQRMSWAARWNETALDCVISKKRLAELEKILENKANCFFLSSREKYEEEKRIYEALKTKMKMLEIGPAKKGFISMMIVYILVLGILLAASWYLHRLAKSHISPKVVMVRWKLPYWVFFLTFYLCQTGVVCYTSIFKEEKSWIGASSFFVSWEAWFFERVAILGLSVIMAIPTTQLWCYLRKELIPEISPIWLRRPDPKSAVGKYVLFLQTWTLIIFGAFSVITVVAVRWAASQQAQFENAYLINTIVGGGLASLMVLKMIRNAIELRRRYQDSLSANFDSWSAIRDANVPSDPTRDFIGESWWKLPANFVGIISATWAILELTGVAKVIVDALK